MKAEGSCHDSTPPREDTQDHDIFISLAGALYVDKDKALEKDILKDIVPRGFDVRIEEIQEMHQQAIKEKNATIALLNYDLKNCEYENLGLQGEIRAKNRQIAAPYSWMEIHRMPFLHIGFGKSIA